MISGSISKLLSGDGRDYMHSNASSQCPIVQEPQIHLASYAERYTDTSRLIRLRFIAQVCPKLRVEALELAIDHVKTTYNIKLYEELHRTLCMEMERSVEEPEDVDACLPSSSGACYRSRSTKYVKNASKTPIYDAYWVEDNTMESTLLLQELDAELNFKKSNSGTTYVRRILEEIGDYHVKSGNLQLAVKFYARARPYCTSSDNVISMFCNLIRVSIYMANWWHVLSYIDETKQYAFGYQNLARVVPARLSCAAGLANMGLKIYKTAAHCFLLTPFGSYDYEETVAPQDVAYYAVLCGLATLESDMLELGCLNSDSFQPFLKLSPQIRELLSHFINNELEHCVQLLNEMRDFVRLDVYLAPHVDALYDKILARIQDKKHNDVLLAIQSSTTIVSELTTAQKDMRYFEDTDE